MKDATTIFGLLGLIIFPSLLFLWVSLDLVRSLLARAARKKVLAVIGQASKTLRIEMNTVHADFLVSTLSDTVASIWVPRPVRTMTKQFISATISALHSESHNYDLSEDASYVTDIADLFDRVYFAMERGNLVVLGEALGQLFAVDVLDRRLSPSEVSEENISEWIQKNASRPLLLVGITLEKAVEALKSQDTGRAKAVVDHALECLPLVLSEEQLAFPLLVLNWAQSYLHHVADVGSAGSHLIWKTPEEAVISILSKAALPAKREHLHQLMTIIARSRDAYRTRRI